MILYNWRGHARNFGDELNILLWPRLLPDFFDRDETTHFLGIGSILDGRHGKTPLKLVAGSGYGGYEAPAGIDESWIVHWVRGPRTAEMLGLPPSLGLGDPASLLPVAGLAPPLEARDIGFMPHFESAIRGAWGEAAAKAGLTLIDPRDDPTAVIAAIARCRMLIGEALHGIIVADALRVPWVAIAPLARIHRPKWADWAETLDLTIAFQTLPPSTVLERAHLTGLGRFHAGRRLLHRMDTPLVTIARERYTSQAAAALRLAAACPPQLSGPAALERGQARMMDAIAALRRDPLRGWRRATSAPVPAADALGAPRLHGRGVSAYQDAPGWRIA